MDWKAIGEKSNTTYEIPDRWLLIHYYEALNILFRVENALRLFVYVILKVNFLEKWFDINISAEDGGNTTILALARKRVQQAKGYGYLGYDITCPVMHLNSGELSRIITHDSYWPIFKEYFRGNKQIMETKLEEIGSIRNALAHFRPVKKDDVDVIKQNAKHTLMAVEECLLNLLFVYQIVPTNTSDTWYTQIKPIGGAPCSVDIYQSDDEHWLRVALTHDCTELDRKQYGDSYITWRLLTLNSSAILRQYPNITKHVIHLSERLPYLQLNKELNTDYKKIVSMVFRKDVLAAHAGLIKQDLEQLVLKINEETELVSQDHLARGVFVHSVTANAWMSGEGDKKRWQFSTDDLLTALRSDDPPEYWGSFESSGGDFISGSRSYPWMPSNVAGDEKWS